MKKIMFNDKYGLTDAVLRHRKTMTRRLVGNCMTEDDIKAYLKGYTELANKCAQYKIGEVVAVAQTYKDIMEKEYVNRRAEDEICSLVAESHPGCTNKMFVKAELMPHIIRITDIKVERLQDISDEDCIKEGILESYTGYSYEYKGKNGFGYYGFSHIKDAFASLIDGVSGKCTWENNPFVFAYEFKPY